MNDDASPLPPWHLVTVHGFMGSPFDWDPVLAGLDSGIAATSVCLPGHQPGNALAEGHSLNEALKALVAAISRVDPSRRLAVAGYSMGGRLLLQALGSGLISPEAVLLVSSSPGLEDARERTARRRADAQWAARIRSEAWSGLLRAWYTQPVFQDLLDDPVQFDALLASRMPLEACREGLAKVIVGMSPGELPSMWHRIRRLSIPLLAMAGERDARYVDIVERVQRLSRGAQAVIVPKAGHALLRVAPGAVAKAINHFLQRS
ncbi:MAG TPA: alpha/beta fold hydrolase [Kiritimatiellia bacterium]|nr:alpha/beta fold hydrolase [Kiritimatiellia bacterium]